MVSRRNSKMQRKLGMGGAGSKKKEKIGRMSENRTSPITISPSKGEEEGAEKTKSKLNMKST